MIIKSKHHFLWYPLVKRYVLSLVKKHFQKIVFKGSFEDKNYPVLLIANHVSWWDGFWVLYFVHHILNKRLFCYMMLEAQLKKYFMFKYAGGFSIHKNSRSAIASLNHTIELLKDSNKAVLLFPQGKIYSLYDENIHFEKGIEKVLQGIKNSSTHILFIANRIDYFSNSKPTLTTYFEEYKPAYFTCEEIEKAYHIFYKNSTTQQIKQL